MRAIGRKSQDSLAGGRDDLPPSSVNVRNLYDSDTLRPARFEVRWTVDGRPRRSLFENAPGGAAP